MVFQALERFTLGSKQKAGKELLLKFIKRVVKYFCKCSMQVELLTLKSMEVTKPGLLLLKELFMIK